MIDTDIAAKLAAEFDPTRVRISIQRINNERNRCQVAAHLDARIVHDRLNEVFGIGGWSVAHELIDTKGIVKTRITLNELGASYEDFGYSDASNNSDKPEHLKAAASDGLKRAAVALGIGGYLYLLPMAWIAYDDNTKKAEFSTLAELIAGKSNAAPAQPQSEKPAARQQPAPASSNQQPWEQLFFCDVPKEDKETFKALCKTSGSWHFDSDKKKWAFKGTNEQFAKIADELIKRGWFIAPPSEEDPFENQSPAF